MSFRKIPLIWLIVLMHCTCGLAQSDPSFQLQAEEEGVKIYTREEVGGDMSVRVITVARTEIGKAKSMLDNVGGYPNWVHRCDNAYVLEQGEKGSFIYVSVIDMPFPFRDREVVALVTQNTGKDEIHRRTIDARPGAMAPTPGRERMTVYSGDWLVTPLVDRGVELQCTVRTDAGSGLPGWLRREILTGGPVKTMVNLRNTLEAKP